MVRQYPYILYPVSLNYVLRCGNRVGSFPAMRVWLGLYSLQWDHRMCLFQAVIVSGELSQDLLTIKRSC